MTKLGAQCSITLHQFSSSCLGIHRVIALSIMPSDWTRASSLIKQAGKGDLVEIDRGPYCHWMVFIEDDWGIHVTQMTGVTEGTKAQKRADKIEGVVDGDWCRINNHEAAAKNKRLTKRSPNDIEIIASDGIENEYIVVPYEAMGRNCEYYATKWVYGTGFSIQVENADPRDPLRFASTASRAASGSLSSSTGAGSRNGGCSRLRSS